MRTFGTRGPVDPEKNYVVSRSEEISDFINRVKEGRYIVIFAPRQTGKTTFFQWALDKLTNEDETYFPIQLDFEEYKNLSDADFYASLYDDICEEIETVFQKRGDPPPEALVQLLENAELTNHVSMRRFFRNLAILLSAHRIIITIDEFDGIPQAVVSDFLYTLRRIYISRSTPRSPHSLGLVGVKSITQLDYDRSVSPFNIQDEFALSNFTIQQVRELLSQYTEEVGQAFAPEVIETLYKQTTGQPFLVNRFAQILTEEAKIPKTETIRMEHFLTAHSQILQEQNTNIQHLITNIRRDPRFKSILMKIASYESGTRFNPYDPLINQLTIYGVIVKGTDGLCEIACPIYQHCMLQAFTPPVNGLEQEYFHEDTGTGFLDYLTSAGQIDMDRLLDNFRDFITRAGFRILQVPDTPREYVGQHLLYAYLDQFINSVSGAMYLEVQTGRSRIDLIIIHNVEKYIVETKIWEGNRRYEARKKQLAVYLNLEGVAEGYYVVFDHRQKPEPRVETEIVAGVSIRSYVIPVIQAVPSNTL